MNNGRPLTTNVLPVLILLCSASLASAQTPSTAAAPADDTPSIKVGAVIFPDYTYTLDPATTDADGNSIHLNQFNVTRAFLDVTGRISRHIGFRVTPDVARETSSFSNIAGSVELRIMYAYAEFNFDDWMTPGSFARFGIQPTPWIDFADRVYRYRFQGTTFGEREGYLSPADAGASFRYAFGSEYGDLHVGV